jgi:hypothetical protein
MRRLYKESMKRHFSGFLMNPREKRSIQPLFSIKSLFLPGIPASQTDTRDRRIAGNCGTKSSVGVLTHQDTPTWCRKPDFNSEKIFWLGQ